MKFLGKFLDATSSGGENGATAAEYALMISGIAIAVVGATLFLGEKLSDALVRLSSIIY